MPDIAQILQAGAQNPLAYIPAAVLLGGLHALEPGHSKSMMAAYIIAVRGSRAQAVVLGVMAAIGHTIVIWALAVLGLWLGDKLILDKAEPWLELATGLLIVALGVRIFFLLTSPHGHDHGHDHHHGHDHDHGHVHEPAPARAETGTQGAGPASLQGEAAHAHAARLERRLTGRPVSTWDIAWFGLSAGLMPCPAAFAVLLVCLQMKAFGLGLALVASFSIGLAVTLVTIGVIAAWSADAATKHFDGLDRWSHRLPYISAAIVVTVGLAIVLRGLHSLNII